MAKISHFELTASASFRLMPSHADSYNVSGNSNSCNSTSKSDSSDNSSCSVKILYFCVLSYKAVTHSCVNLEFLVQAGNFRSGAGIFQCAGESFRVQVNLNEDARDVFEASGIFSNIIDEDLADIRIRFNIPNDIELLYLEPFQTTNCPSPRCIATTNIHQLWDFEFPFIPFLTIPFLSRYGSLPVCSS